MAARRCEYPTSLLQEIRHANLSGWRQNQEASMSTLLQAVQSPVQPAHPCEHAHGLETYAACYVFSKHVDRIKKFSSGRRTAFECPFPHCGRQFNVNSNMRRHYRNHIRVGAPSHGTGKDGHRRIHSSLLGNSPEAAARLAVDWKNDRGSDGAWESLDDGEASDDEEMDELHDEDELEPEQCDNASESPSSSPPPASPPPGRIPKLNSAYSDTRPRSPLSGPAFPRSPRMGNTYTPSSSTLVQSCKDPSVSTTLRPAFPLASPLVRVKREATD
jgi:hypothetical protein